MNVEMGTEVPHFLEKEYINGIFVTVHLPDPAYFSFYTTFMLFLLTFVYCTVLLHLLFYFITILLIKIPFREMFSYM